MNPRNPIRLTVALLTFNRQAYLRKAVEAILTQTYHDFEFLILDNGSTDCTPQYVIGLTDPRIRYVRNPPGSSIEFNSVSAYHIARGERVIVTHDDDIMEPDMLYRQMAYLDAHPEAKLVWTHIRTMDQHGQFISQNAEILPDRTFAVGEYIANFLTERRWPMPSTVMLERRLVAERLANLHYFRTTKIRIKATNIQLAGIEDIRIPAKVNTRHAIGFIGIPLLRYRIHAAQGTHAVDLSKPSIYLYKLIRRMARQIPGRPIPEIGFITHILKHQTQNDLTNIESPSTPTQIRRRIASYWQRISDDPLLTPDALYAALPTAIAAYYLGMLPETPSQINRLGAPDNHTTAIRQFYVWANRLRPGFSIFDGVSKGRRILIFGSALVSALLLLDAQRSGHQIIACIDSNLFRQGCRLLGIPIHPPRWLTDHADYVDLVIFSSEKDQEDYLTKRIVELTTAQIQTLSWKDLLQKNALSGTHTEANAITKEPAP